MVVVAGREFDSVSVGRGVFLYSVSSGAAGAAT